MEYEQAKDVLNCQESLTHVPDVLSWLEETVQESILELNKGARTACRYVLSRNLRETGSELLGGSVIDGQLIIKIRSFEGDVQDWYVGDLPDVYSGEKVGRTYSFRQIEGQGFVEY